jgi:hypothetical protein
MYYSKPSLHAPVLESIEHKNRVTAAFAMRASKALAAAAPRIAVAPASVNIALTTVSMSANFDAYVDILFKGSSPRSPTSLLVDSGNASLIVPSIEEIQSLQNFSTDYAVLAQDVQEPWGCPADILQGPIELPTITGGSYSIPNCIFLACKGPNANGDRTANFGIGCISPWSSISGHTLQSPLSYGSLPCAVVSYAAADTVLSLAQQPNIAGGSALVLYPDEQPGFKLFDILPGKAWMALTPLSLSIGSALTQWPGSTPSPIAMIDTGGGPVYLSDPLGYLYKTLWPEQVAPPDWTQNGSVACQAVKDDLALAIGDATGAYTYKVASELLPASAQNLTLVICQTCYYMMQQNGLNIGGISALFNYISINYVSKQVGFRSKVPSAEVS